MYMKRTYKEILTLRNVIAFLGVGILCILLALYVSRQAQSFLQGPTINLIDEPAQLQHEKAIVLTGETRNIVHLTLNGKEVHTNPNGTFKHRLILEDGYSIMTLSAEDRFGRSTSLVREYVYVSQHGSEDAV